MDIKKNPNSNKGLEKNKIRSDIPLAILLGCIFISMAILSSSNTFDINGNYLVGASPNATVNTETIIKDDLNNRLRISAYSEAFVCSRLDDVAVQFQYNIADFDVNTEEVDTGTVTQNSSQALLSTGSGLNAEVHIESVEAVRYRPGHEAYGLYTAAFVDGGVANVEQLTGVYNEDQDGFVIGFNGTTPIVGRFKAGERLWIPQSDWDDPINGSGESKCNVDFTKLHQWRISYGWLGVAQINYEVQCGEGQRWVNFHTLDLTNIITTPTINNPVLPVQMHIIKNGSAQNVRIRTSSWGGGICNGGAIEAGKRHFVGHRTQSISANTLTNLMTIKSNQTFFGKINRIDGILEYLSIGTDGTKLVEIYILRNANTGLLDSDFDRVNANNSVMGINYSAVTVTGGVLENVFAFGKSDARDVLLEPLFIDLHKNETITIAAISSGSSTIIPSLRWEELY